MEKSIDKDKALNNIVERLENDFSDLLQRSGMMFRLFKRVKTLHSIKHKMKIKGDSYRQKKSTIDDIIGFRIVLYFQDDVDVLNLFLSSKEVVSKSIDYLDQSTFSPQRLNITRAIPEKYIEEFRQCLPEEYACYIGNTYEVQIRTIFSEGWHEVEHDLRYKCKDDWQGCETFSRSLNGVIATLETAEWSMKALFHEMAYQNFLCGNYRAMLRNKMRIRLKDDDFSPAVSDFLKQHQEVAKGFMRMDRMVFLMTLLGHKKSLLLTYDNIIFFVNRLEGLNEELKLMESEETKKALDDFLVS